MASAGHNVPPAPGGPIPAAQGRFFSLLAVDFSSPVMAYCPASAASGAFGAFPPTVFVSRGGRRFYYLARSIRQRARRSV